MAVFRSAARNAEIDRHFDAAMDLEAAARAAYLDALRARDPDLAAAVEGLLGALNRPDPRLEGANRWFCGRLWDEMTCDARPGPDLTGDRVGAYRVLRELGRGGMSTVYLAERADGEFEQRVALKFLAAGAAHATGLRRFGQERQILAALNHRHIARLLDGGTDLRGAPYIVMEYVKGRPIDDVCRDVALSLDRRLELFDTVAAAVEYAHRHLVVHRDLKPSNILVTDDGDVKLLDFGIAKLLDADPAGGFTAPPTRTLVRALTPEYASPEQVRGDRISTASDIYQLGTLLYELLTGRRPFTFAAAATVAEIQQTICETEPVPPSAAAAMEADARCAGHMAGSWASPARHLRGDLDNIVLKALEKQPDSRYTAVGELREDLQRFRQGLPVHARPATLRYRAVKFARRHRAGLFAGAVVLALLAGYAATITVQTQRIAAETARTARVGDFLASLFTLANPGITRGNATSVPALLDAGAERVSTTLGDDPGLQAALMTVLGDVNVTLGRYGEAVEQLGAALSIRRRLPQVSPEDVAQTAFKLGRALHFQGQYAQAEELLREVVDTRLQVLGDESPWLAIALNELGDLLHTRGALADAEEVLQRALAVHRPVNGTHDDVGAVTRRNLANVLRDRGALQQAERLYRDALGIVHDRLGASDPLVALNRSELALLLAETGRWNEAEALLHENVATYAVLYPDGHPMEGTTSRNLGVLRLRQNRLQEAADAFARALENYRRTLSGDHTLIPRVQRYQAEVALASGDAVMAAATAEDAVDRLRRAGLPHHPAVADALETLGLARLAQNRPADAVDLLTESLAVRSTISVPSDPRLARTRRHLERASSR
jgi:eukaryotic-like serine/threonine-protein kinase